jgi:CheY-like chemotaxis protein
LQADGRYLVLNKPLHGSRLRRLLSFLAQAGKPEQNHWEVHSNWEKSMFGGPVSPKPSFPQGKNVDKSYSLDCGRDFAQTLRTPSLRTSIFRKSSLEDLGVDQRPDRVSVDAGSDASTEDARRSISKDHSALELGVLLGNQKGESTRKSSSDSLSNESEVPRNLQPDEGGDPFVQPKSLNRTASALQRYQASCPVSIPYGPDESRSLLSVSTPDSPTSGASTPEISRRSTSEGSGGAGRQKREIASADGQTSHEKALMNGPPTAFKHNALSGIDILLVEDTAVIQRLVSMTLKRLGANVTVVGDGLQAVTAVAKSVEATRDDAQSPSSVPHFDVVLMDCAVRLFFYHTGLYMIKETASFLHKWLFDLLSQRARSDLASTPV